MRQFGACVKHPATSVDFCLDYFYVQTRNVQRRVSFELEVLRPVFKMGQNTFLVSQHSSNGSQHPHFSPSPTKETDDDQKPQQS